MPSKEDICVIQDICETIPGSKKDFLTADVEELVAAIKQNLQLKSKPRNSVCRKHRRMSPYSAPVRTVCRRSSDKENASEHSKLNCKYCHLKTSHPIPNSPEDPYEMLQVLLREGSLIKEAVKRLEHLDLTNRTPKIFKYDFDTESESEIIDVEI